VAAMTTQKSTIIVRVQSVLKNESKDINIKKG